jgi:hypothetical protein
MPRTGMSAAGSSGFGWRFKAKTQTHLFLSYGPLMTVFPALIGYIERASATQVALSLTQFHSTGAYWPCLLFFDVTFSLL